MLEPEISWGTLCQLNMTGNLKTNFMPILKEMRTMEDTKQSNLITDLTVEIVAAYVSNNPVAAGDVPVLINSVYGAVADLKNNGGSPESEVPQEPAVSIKKSLRNDRLICLDCGKKFKSIKRHIGSRHDLTPDAYRKKWGLKSDYPMVAPDYAEKRSSIAKTVGLGQKRG